MEKTSRFYKEKKQPKNWMKVIKNNSVILLENSYIMLEP